MTLRRSEQSTPLAKYIGVPLSKATGDKELENVHELTTLAIYGTCRTSYFVVGIRHLDAVSRPRAPYPWLYSGSSTQSVAARPPNGWLLLEAAPPLSPLPCLNSGIARVDRGARERRQLQRVCRAFQAVSPASTPPHVTSTQCRRPSKQE